MALLALKAAVMDFKAANTRRKTIQRNFRIFEDQLEALQWLAENKHRGRRNVSDLVRDFLDQGIDSELETKKSH